MTTSVKRGRRRSTGPIPRSPGVVLTVAGVVGVVVASFLPWGGSGRVSRSSFELVQAAERLDLMRGGPREAAAVAWYLLPVLGAVVWLAATFDRAAVTAALGAVTGVLAVGAALIVTSSPLKIELGVPIAVVAGGAAVGGAALIALERRRHG